MIFSVLVNCVNDCLTTLTPNVWKCLVKLQWYCWVDNWVNSTSYRLNLVQPSTG